MDEFSHFLFILVFCNYIRLSNNIPFAYLSPIWYQMMNTYDVSSNALLWTANMFYLSFPLAIILMPLIMQHIEKTIQIASLFNLVGCWLLYLQQSFQLLLIAYFFIALASMLTYSLPIYLAQRWFVLDQQILATCFGILATFVGADYGQLFSYLYFDDSDEGFQFDSKFSDLNLSIAILATISGLLCLFIKYIPNDDVSQVKVLRQLNMLSQECIWDMFTFGLFIGITWAYATAVASELFIFEYTYQELGYVYAGFISGGILSTIITAYKLDQYTSQNDRPNYDKYLQGMIILGLIPFVILTLFTQYLDFIVILISNTLVGISQYSIIPVALQSFAEKYYPIHPLFLITLLNLIANISSLTIQYLSIQNILINYPMFVILVLTTPIQLYTLILYHTKYKRFELSN